MKSVRTNKLKYMYLLIAAVLSAITVSMISAQAANLIPNGDLSSTAGWWETTGSISSGEFCATVDADPTGNPWDELFGLNDELSLEAGKTYTYSFDAYSSEGSGFYLTSVIQDADDSPYKKMDEELSTEMTTYSSSFIMSATDDAATLNFQFGGQASGGMVCIDNVTLTEEADTTTVTVGAGNQLSGGEFDSSSISPWWDNTVDGAVADEEFCVTVGTDPDSEPWDEIFGYTGVELLQGGEYTYSFDAYAKEGTGLSFYSLVQLDGTPFTEYERLTADVTSTKETFESTFVMSESDDDAAQVNFQLGGSASEGVICIDNVFITGGEDASVPTPTTAPGVTPEPTDVPVPTTEPPVSSGNEQLVNGDFETGDLDPWWSNADTGAVTGNEFCVDLGADPLADPWDEMLGHDAVPLVAGETYIYQFDAYGSTDLSFISIIQNQGDFSAYTRIEADVTTESQNFSKTFTMGDEGDESSQVNFQFGGSADTGTVCIDNISLQGGAERELYTPDTGSPVRVNQHGYLLNYPKGATFVTDPVAPVESPLAWSLLDSNGAVVDSGMTVYDGLDFASGDNVHLIDFSDYNMAGTGFTVQVGSEVSFPFDIGSDLYDQLAIDSLHYFYHNRSNIDIEAQYVGAEYARDAGHTDTTLSSDVAVSCGGLTVDLLEAYSCPYSLDVRGGWYDAGDHGKYVVNGGISIWKLLNTYERSVNVTDAENFFNDGEMPIPENGNGVDDILDEARWEIEFMMAMQVPAGETYAGMAHHKVHDTKWSGLPLLAAESEGIRILRPTSTAATLNLAATAAQCARIWDGIDDPFADECLASAETAWDAAVANPAMYILGTDNGGDGGGAYNDSAVGDEFYWAAAELYITTGKQVYLDYMQSSDYHDGAAMEDEFNWQQVGPLGAISLATVSSSLPMADMDAIKSAIQTAAMGYVDNVDDQGYPTSYDKSSNEYVWGSNNSVMNNSIVIGTAYDLTGNQMYADAVVRTMDYLLGRNGLNNSYITGYGDYYSQNQHHRHWANQFDEMLPNPPAGSVSGGPNSSIQDPVAKLELAGCEVAPQKCYIDHLESWSTNEVTVNWNSALVWVAAFAADVADNEIMDDAGVTVNCDSTWNLIDIILIKRYDVFIIPATNDCAVASDNSAMYMPECDRNGDGQCGLIDAVIIQQCNAFVMNPYCADLQ